MSIRKFGFTISPNVKKTKQICFLIIDLLQQFRKEDHVVSLAILWVLICERYNVRPVEVLTCADKILKETLDEQHATQLKALKEYMKHELK